MYLDKSIDFYLKELASKKPVPGGGSVSALVGALGVGLLTMVGLYSVNKIDDASVENKLENILTVCSGLKKELTLLIDKDVQSYTKLSNAYKLPKDTEPQKEKRSQEIQENLVFAAGTSFAICKYSLDALKSIPFIKEHANKYLMSDIKAAGSFLESAFVSAGYTLEDNLSLSKGQLESRKKDFSILKEEFVRIREKINSV